MGERRVTADGRILEKMPDGTIVEVGRQQAPSQAGPQGAIPIGPRNTYRASEEQRQQSADARAEAAAARAAAADARAAEAADRQAREWAATHNPDGSPRQIRKMLPMPEAAAKRLENDIGVYGTLDRLGNSFQPDYAGNSITGGFENWAQRRYSGFGTPGQAQWWQDLQTMDNTVRNQLFGASLTAGEQQAWEGTTVLPSMDAPEVKKNLARRREILQGALARRNKFLKANGYDPEAVDALYGEYGPGIMAPQQQGQKPRNVMDEITIRAPDITAAPPGSDKRALPYPPGFQEEYAAYMAQNMNGNMDPAAYAAFRNAHAQKYGYGPRPAGYFEAEAQKLNDYYNQGGRTIGGISPIEEDMTTSQMINNALANNPLSVAAMNAGDAGSGGLISAVAGDKVNMLNQANPNAALVGQIGGAILGAEGTGAIGRATLGKLAPMLMRGGRGAALGRGLAADATYSGVYGANTGQDPFESALLGGAGSAAGRGVGTVVGKAFTGVTSPTAQAVRKLGVTMTPGQIARASLEDRPSMFGLRKLMAGAEDATANTPMLNSSVSAARERSYQQGNQAMFRDAAGGRPIDGFGPAALEQLDNLKNAAYTDAAQGVNILLDDPRFIQQAGDANAFGIAQDAARSRGDWSTSMNQGLSPILGSGDSINGRQLQDALRYTQAESGAWNRAANGIQPDPSARGLSTAFDKMNDAFVSSAARNAPHAIPKLREANRLYRNLKVMDNATGAATANGGLASPMQVLNAIKGSNSKLGQGRGMMALQRSPLYQTAATLQKVLPNQAPPTGVNTAPVLALLGAGSYGAGEATDSTALKSIGGLMLASLPYTKAGGKALNKALLDRPDALKALGSAVRKKQGLFGAASIPLLLESQ